MKELLLPGVKIKRWIAVILLGILFLVVGCLFLFRQYVLFIPLPERSVFWWGLYLLLLGIVVTLLGCRFLIQRVVTAVMPEKQGKITSLLAAATAKEKGPNIVVIGGGTGSYQALRGLKRYTKNLTAVVSMADSGGSTGKLRNEYGVLPPGDVRRCLIALSEETPLMQKLFQHRFGKGSLAGHNFGNLFLTALENVTGSDEKAILEASKILNIKGKVFPVTLDSSHLHAELENGTIIVGETNIDIPKHDPNLRIKRVFLQPKARAYQQAVEAIKQADMVIIGPGDLYTSIIANLLVQGIPQALQQSAATVIYVCNLMTKHGETTNFTASMHLKEVLRYLGCPVDYIIVNKKIPDKKLLQEYEQQQQFLVENDMDELKKLGVKVVLADLLKEPVLVRHDPDRLARTILEVFRQEGK